ncbi:MAG: transcriptional regulator [Anaerolinea sp.]|nr:transcriptional regulator [Anaerolinea sp.]
MAEYGQFCPMAKAAEILCERWTLVVIRELTAGSRRFNDLRRGVPLMSPTLLSRRLKQLEAAGVVHRVRDEAGRAYELTPAGAELKPLVESMAQWGSRWVRRRLSRDDLDAGLLMWDIRRQVDASRFPAERVVVHFSFPDAPAGKRHWWLVSDAGTTDLCLEDPGHEVDLHVEAPLYVMTAVWMRDVSFTEAERTLGLKVAGTRDLRSRLPGWLGASSLASAPRT